MITNKEKIIISLLGFLSISLILFPNLAKILTPYKLHDDNAAAALLRSTRLELERAYGAIKDLEENRLHWQQLASSSQNSGTGLPIDKDVECPAHMEPKKERSVLPSDIEIWNDRPHAPPTFEELYQQVNNVEYDPATSGIATFDNPNGKVAHMDYPHSSVWNKGDEIMEILEKALAPRKFEFIVEVGSMHGGSAIRMALELDKRGFKDVPLLCIDPWSGDLNMWLNRVVWEHLDPRGGRATTYDQFMVNVKSFIDNGMSDKHIVPFAVSSIIGARWLQATGFQPSVIYLDSAHEEDETYMELCLYWEVLPVGGILMGDDYGWAAVRHDVDRFVSDRGLTLNMFNVYYNWWIKKEKYD